MLSADLPRGRTVNLRQLNDSNNTTGTTLWPGGQVLAAYLSDSKAGAKARVLELGAGIGYLALSLQAVGYDVTATDIEPVVSLVLRPNAGSTVTVAELDWFDLENPLLKQEWDVIVTADTVYALHMLTPLWAAIEAAARNGKGAMVFVAMERRDPAVVDAAIEMGRERGCPLRKIATGRVGKAVERAGWDWEQDDWADVEIWKGRWK